MRRISRCHGSSSGAFFSIKYSRFSCGSEGSDERIQSLFLLRASAGCATAYSPGFADTLPGFSAALSPPAERFLRTFIAVDAVVHQRVAGVEQFLHFVDAIALFALGDVFTGEDQIVDDRAGVGPAAKQIVIFKNELCP
jgi:hypothetical protein